MQEGATEGEKWAGRSVRRIFTTLGEREKESGVLELGVNRGRYW